MEEQDLTPEGNFFIIFLKGDLPLRKTYQTPTI
jgi:hypothetical protein